MALDAVVIAASGADSFSGTHPLKLTIEGKTADIQTVFSHLQKEGRATPCQVPGVDTSWASAPRLNGIYLANYLTRCNFNVALIDRYQEQKDEFQTLLLDTPRAIVISTSFICNKQSLTALVADIRRYAAGVPIIAGGPFVYLSYSMLRRSQNSDYFIGDAKNDYLFLQVQQEPSVDLFIVSVRGEIMLGEALKRIKAGQTLKGLPNTAHLNETGYDFAPRVDDFRAPNCPIDWHALPRELFQSAVVPLQASSGCPYQCAFCNFVKDRRLAYVKPAEQLIEELKMVRRRGARYIWFVDDNFRLGRSDLEAVCRKFIRAELGLQWMTFIRASTLEDVDVDILRQAGCIEVQLGLESADPQVLRNMDKKATPELYDKILHKLLAAGISCSCYFLFGFPGETVETAQRTISFIQRHEYPDLPGSIAWSLFPFILSPLSPVYEPAMREKYGLHGYLRKWRHRTMDSDQAMQYVLKAFHALKYSGPIYREDSLELLHQLNPATRKQFHATRHKLSKTAASGKLAYRTLLDAFSNVLNRQ